MKLVDVHVRLIERGPVGGAGMAGIGQPRDDRVVWGALRVFKGTLLGHVKGNVNLPCDGPADDRIADQMKRIHGSRGGAEDSEDERLKIVSQTRVLRKMM